MQAPLFWEKALHKKRSRTALLSQRSPAPRRYARLVMYRKLTRIDRVESLKSGD